MKVDLEKLKAYRRTCILAGESIDFSSEQAELIKLLLEKISKTNNEIDDKQLIVSRKFSNESIYQVIFQIYGKLPKKIIIASSKCKIVQL